MDLDDFKALEPLRRKERAAEEMYAVLTTAHEELERLGATRAVLEEIRAALDKADGKSL